MAESAAATAADEDDDEDVQENEEPLVEERAKSKRTCRLTVAFTHGVEYILPLMSAVLADAYPHCRLALLRESELDPASADVHLLLHSVLDGSKTGVGFDDGCKQHANSVIQKWALSVNPNPNSRAL